MPPWPGVASLASNQVEYSLLHRRPETNGVLDACRSSASPSSPISRWPAARSRRVALDQPASGLRFFVKPFAAGIWQLSSRSPPCFSRSASATAKPWAGGPALADRERRGPAHPRSEEPQAGRRQRRGAHLPPRTGRDRSPRRGDPRLAVARSERVSCDTDLPARPSVAARHELHSFSSPTTTSSRARFHGRCPRVPLQPRPLLPSAQPGACLVSRSPRRGRCQRRPPRRDRERVVFEEALAASQGLARMPARSGWVLSLANLSRGHSERPRQETVRVLGVSRARRAAGSARPARRVPRDHDGHSW